MHEQLQNKEWLEMLYLDQRKTLQQIADIVGCNKSTVGRALKRHGIITRARTSKYPELSDRNWLKSRYIDDGMSLNEIADMVGSSPGNVREHLIQSGIETRDSSEGLAAKYPDGRNGELHPMWNGGRHKTYHGYIYVYAPDHPNATKAGYVFEHRLAMEQQLGRYLLPDEDVHHINEDRADNRPENLVVLSRSEHKLLHAKMKRNYIKKLETTIEIMKARITELEEQLEDCQFELKGYAYGGH